MLMSSRVKLNWKVHSREWDHFLEYVRSKYGGIKGHTGREVELAMQEWIDADDYNGIEKRIDRLVRAAGRTPEELAEKKRSTDVLVDEGVDLTRVGARVDETLKGDFKAFTKEHTDDRLGIALTRALRERRDGGRSGRLEEKLDRIADDAEGLLSEIAASEDADPEAGLSLREKRTIAICNRLQGGEFTVTDLHETIGAVAGDSKPTIQDYEQRVLDRLDYAQHPNNPKVYIPTRKAEKIAEETGTPGPDAPAIDRKDYSALSREEKIRGIQIDLARRSRKNNGRYQVDADTIRQETFNGCPTPSHVRNLMDAASNADGYSLARCSGTPVLRVNIDYIPAIILLDAGMEDVLDALIDGSLDALEDDQDQEQEQEQEQEQGVESEASSEMDQLMNAEPARTDGGTDMNG